MLAYLNSQSILNSYHRIVDSKGGFQNQPFRLGIELFSD